MRPSRPKKSTLTALFANSVAQSVTAEGKLLRLVKTMLSGKGPWQNDINIHYSCLESMKIHFCSARARAYLFMAVRARLQFAMLIRAEHKRYTYTAVPQEWFHFIYNLKRHSSRLKTASRQSKPHLLSKRWQIARQKDKAIYEKTELPVKRKNEADTGR